MSRCVRPRRCGWWLTSASLSRRFQPSCTHATSRSALSRSRRVPPVASTPGWLTRVRGRNADQDLPLMFRRRFGSLASVAVAPDAPAAVPVRRSLTSCWRRTSASSARRSPTSFRRWSQAACSHRRRPCASTTERPSCSWNSTRARRSHCRALQTSAQTFEPRTSRAGWCCCCCTSHSSGGAPAKCRLCMTVRDAGCLSELAAFLS